MNEWLEIEYDEGATLLRISEVVSVELLRSDPPARTWAVRVTLRSGAVQDLVAQRTPASSQYLNIKRALRGEEPES